MTATELRDHLDRLGLSQLAFVRLTGRSPRSVRRWVARDPAKGAPIPKDIAMLVTRLHPHDTDVDRARSTAP